VNRYRSWCRSIIFTSLLEILMVLNCVFDVSRPHSSRIYDLIFFYFAIKCFFSAVCYRLERLNISTKLVPKKIEKKGRKKQKKKTWKICKTTKRYHISKLIYRCWLISVLFSGLKIDLWDFAWPFISLIKILHWTFELTDSPLKYFSIFYNILRTTRTFVISPSCNLKKCVYEWERILRSHFFSKKLSRCIILGTMLIFCVLGKIFSNWSIEVRVKDHRCPHLKIERQKSRH
jgi:hypothetical protein